MIQVSSIDVVVSFRHKNIFPELREVLKQHREVVFVQYKQLDIALRNNRSGADILVFLEECSLTEELAEL